MGVNSTKQGARVLLGRKQSMEGVIGTDILLDLGVSCVSSWVPNDVAGLTRPVLDNALLCANELFGRARACSDCGRPPGPTLAENELLEVFLDEDEFDREEKEEENDGLRLGPAFAVVLTAELIVLDEGGAGIFLLIGSAAISTNVLLFGTGSGTVRCQNNDMRVGIEAYDWKEHACGLVLVVA